MRNVCVPLLMAGFIILAAAPGWAQQADPVAVLKSEAPYLEKSEACRVLALQGGPEAVPALAALLPDEKLSHMARLALEAMPCPEAGEALRAALATTSGDVKVGVIGSLAARGDTQAVPALIALLPDADAGVARAAAKALGVIATPGAGQALADALVQAGTPPDRVPALCEALLDSADSLTQAGGKGQRAQALAFYDTVRATANAPAPICAAALRGTILARGGKAAVLLLVEALVGTDGAMADAALRAARELGGGDGVSAALAEALPALPVEPRIRLIEVLGYRGGAGAGPALVAQAGDGPVDVRVAALEALTQIAYTPALKTITTLAAAEDEALAKAARNALSYFPGKEGDAALTAMLKNDQPAARVVAVELIGQGGLAEPARILMKTAETDGDEGVRIAALKALKDHAGMAEMPALLDRLLAAGSPAEVQAAEATLGTLCARQKRLAEGDVVIQKAVYGALPDGPSADVTAKVAQIVESGSLSIEASNSNFGDPAPNIVKQLSVTYLDGGTPTTKTVKENETLVLTVASVPAAVTDALCGALDKADAEGALALLRLLGSTAGPKALETVRTAAVQGEGAAQETALRTLCDWPTPDALPAVMDLAMTSSDPTLRVLALRGAVRLLKQSKAETPELFGHYAALMGKAGDAEEKKLMLSGLAQIADVDAFELALTQVSDESVKAEAVQAAASIAKALSGSPREETGVFNGKDLTGWEGDAAYWSVEDGAIKGHSAEPIPDTTYLWSGVQVSDFYLSVEVKLEPVTANSGVQFRSKKIDEKGHALGYQGDIGQDVWGRLYHQGGRGKLDWSDRAEPAVKPGEWNRYEILAVGPAIWTAINGQLGVACLDLGAADERSGLIALQLHTGPPMTVRYRAMKVVHNPTVELAGLTAEQLIAELRVP
ncbi:MAG: DUF1080 domain-containing protein [Candidatus Hydrogenedentes bacterium]|nr:DUF1080 domain-containing protein [Candidatus Hydrogenedentota bacterium]